MGEKKRRAAASRGKSAEQQALDEAERARQLFGRSAYGPALEAIVRALELDPRADRLWAQFAEMVRFYKLGYPIDQRLRTLFERALEHSAVDPGDLVRPVASIALSRPQARALAEPLLARLAQDSVIPIPEIESEIRALRRDALRGEPVPLDTLVAIAHQCFNTEYATEEIAEESAALEKLAQRIAAGPEPAACALYAAYRPLHTLADPQKVAAALGPTAAAGVARRQIVEPALEAELRASIPRMTELAGAVSAAVQRQYEANPYPRWLRMPSMTTEPVLPGLRAERILIAGCGTGQHAIDTARRFPRARILALDLSLSSLAYAKRKTLELGVQNIEYAQADLLRLDRLAERFDLVESSGVLHHLEDPLVGWRVLAALLKPGGAMRIGLYSERARQHVVRARQLIAEQGFDATASGIRRCRAAILARRDDPLLAKLARNEDFYSLSGCRDLLFHVQEHRFDLPRIDAMIASLGLGFLGFEFPDSGITAARYAQRFPRDLNLTDLANWDAYEREYPDTFARMYQFWVRKPG